VKSNSTTTLVILFICGCAASSIPPDVAAAEGADSKYTVSAGIELLHGDYGSDESVDIYSLLPAMNYTFTDNLSAMLIVPYLYQSNNATVPVGGGRFPMQKQAQGAGTGNGGGMGDPGHMGHGGGMGSPGGGHPTDHPSPPEFSDEPQHGLGDVILTVGYSLLEEKEKSPSISTELYVKFPTADEDKGLGTGAYDYGLGLSFGKWLAGWQLDAQVLYILPGSTPSYELSNYWDWSVSSNYLVNEQLSLGLGLAGATSPFSGGDDPLEAQLLGSYFLSPKTSIWALVSFGLSDGSADYGVSVFATVGF